MAPYSLCRRPATLYFVNPFLWIKVPACPATVEEAGGEETVFGRAEIGDGNWKALARVSRRFRLRISGFRPRTRAARYSAVAALCGKGMEKGKTLLPTPVRSRLPKQCGGFVVKYKIS